MGVQWFALWGAPHVMKIQTVPIPYLGTLGLMQQNKIISPFKYILQYLHLSTKNNTLCFAETNHDLLASF